LAEKNLARRRFSFSFSLSLSSIYKGSTSDYVLLALNGQKCFDQYQSADGLVVIPTVIRCTYIYMYLELSLYLYLLLESAAFKCIINDDGPYWPSFALLAICMQSGSQARPIYSHGIEQPFRLATSLPDTSHMPQSTCLPF